MRALFLCFLLACGKGDSGPGSTGAPATGTAITTTTSCTCRSAVIAITVTLDGNPAIPDRLAVGEESATPVELCGAATSPCTADAFAQDYLGTTCTVEATLGAATQTAHCEDHLAGPEPCVCGQDATLELAFTAATTSP